MGVPTGAGSAVLAIAPFGRATAERVDRDRREAVERADVAPGKSIVVTRFVWFKIILVPKSFDLTAIRRLSDVPLQNGKIADAQVSVGMGWTHKF
jgi:hypothetical protein